MRALLLTPLPGNGTQGGTNRQVAECLWWQASFCNATHTHTEWRDRNTRGWWLTVSRGGCVSSLADSTAAHGAVDVSGVNSKVTGASRPLTFLLTTHQVHNGIQASLNGSYTDRVRFNYRAQALIPDTHLPLLIYLCASPSTCFHTCTRTSVITEYKPCVICHSNTVKHSIFTYP